MSAADHRRAHVAEVARCVFVERGWEGTTVDHVAAVASEARSTIFKQIGGKADLLVLACERAEAISREAIRGERASARARTPRRSGRRFDPARERAVVADPATRACDRLARDALLRNRAWSALEPVLAEADRQVSPAVGRQRARWRQLRRQAVREAFRRAGVSPTRVRADVMAELIGPAVYDGLRAAGWSDGEYERWLRRALHREVTRAPD